MLLFRLPSSLSKPAGLAVMVEVAGAESTKDSSKNRDRVAAKLSKPNLDVLLSNSYITPGLLRGEFSYNGKPVSFSKKSETRKAEPDTGVEEMIIAADEEVLDVPPVDLNEGSPKTKDQVEENEVSVKFASLPRLVLLEDVRTSGNVVYISPETRIWFSPIWAQEKLAEVSQVPRLPF